MRTTTLLTGVLLCALMGRAQTADPQPVTPPTGTAGSADAAPASQPATPQVPAEDKRIFGVLPNNRTTEASIPFRKLTAKQKMTIAVKDSFDYPVYPTAGLFASLYQLENQNPSFGQGMQGYAKRFATAYGDQMIGNMMTEGIVPSVFHQDPRYFRVNEGSTGHRLRMALQQIVICRTDNNHRTFNVAEWGGNAISTAISNAYYPDTRTASDNLQKWLIAVATDSFSNILKEFWPDVKRKLQKHKKDDDALVSTGH